MKSVILLLLSFCFVSCAESSKSDAAKTTATSKRYTPLSLEESKKLITPTTYSIAVYNLDKMSCDGQKKIKDINGKVLFNACKEVYAGCEMEGTCQVQQGSKKLLLNVDAVRDGERRFVVIKDSECIYGKGARRDKVKGYKIMCLDPYYSVAADLSIYNLGDVVYIPSAVGISLPDGSTHDGYFVVRDSGGAIKGYGRFDFFSGLKSSSNPLKMAGFSDKGNNVPYYVVKGSEADQFLKKRNFPILPVGK